MAIFSSGHGGLSSHQVARSSFRTSFRRITCHTPGHTPLRLMRYSRCFIESETFILVLLRLGKGMFVAVPSAGAPK